MMNYRSTSYVSFTFFGEEFVPSIFTDLLQIEPSRQGNKGEKGEYGSILKESFWEYNTKECNALEGLENSMELAISLFESKIELINTYAERNNFQSKCFVVIKCRNSEDTGVFFSAKSIHVLHRLNMVLEFCNYIYDEA